MGGDWVEKGIIVKKKQQKKKQKPPVEFVMDKATRAFVKHATVKTIKGATIIELTLKEE